jgi:hypothetical protein
MLKNELAAAALIAVIAGAAPAQAAPGDSSAAPPAGGSAAAAPGKETPASAAPEQAAAPKKKSNTAAKVAVYAAQTAAGAAVSAVVVKALTKQKSEKSTSTKSTTRASLALAKSPGMGRRGAFSPHPLGSKAGLMQLLRSDPTFRSRIAKHFKVADRDIVTWVDKNLNMFKLKQDMKTMVYGVRKGGQVFKVSQTIPKGTKVFGLPDGYVVMKEVCGNPVAAYLPPLPTLVEPDLAGAKAPRIAAAPIITLPAGVAPNAPTKVPGPLSSAVLDTTTNELFNVSAPSPFTPPPPTPPAPPPVSHLPTPNSPPGTHFPPVTPPFLPSTPGGPTDPGLSFSPEHPNVPEVPEVPESPAWILVLAGAAPLVVFLRRRRPETYRA